MLPSAIMFGMSSTEFWEDDPQLYWSYRVSYVRKKETEIKEKTELMKYCCWLQGSVNNVAVSVALNNAFTKKKIEYPSFEKMFNEKLDTPKTELQKELEKETDNDIRQQKEFNYWARM